ncbi:hypothetical protein [Rhodalgimonas zhirmunskyi]|uniref:Uncharacterized protein n=1 Tax=Rhodalgimonas zhirmunskyi TaxID=2964767 RepID=A0AAJ1U4F8_9RHOB|nr:hypothetical protein [Rhodoalgimonas zhirmunskyi]MDQ2093490.1 hypothetical protein [Rhodoalgimonas zhirmunskyi]
MRRLLLSHRALALAMAVLIVLCPGFPGGTGGQATAGPWPREKGHGFLASATQVDAAAFEGPYGVYSTVYLEYGLGRNWTVGMDIGHGISGKHKLIAFLRHPVFQGESGLIAALEIGGGTVAGEPTIRPGFSLGKGLSFTNGRSGWLSLETYGELRLVSRRTDFKADATFGVTHSDRFKTIWQLQGGVSSGDPSFLRLAPSVVVRTGRQSHVELGASADIYGGDRLGLKIGLWRDF